VGSKDSLKTYIVHSEALISRSVFFRKALSGPWKEANERVVRMPDDDIETLELYLHLVITTSLLAHRTRRATKRTDMKSG